jgi:hypothetical protein
MDVFDFVLVSPPPWSPGEGMDCHLPKEIEGFGPIAARIRGYTYLLFSLGP